MAIRLFQTRAWQGIMYKLSGLFGWLYAIMMASQMALLEVIIWLALALVVSLGSGGIGYLINDWWDREADALLGKPNIFALLTRTQWGTLLFVLLLMAVLPWLALPFTHWSAFLLGFQLVAYWLYAAPPFRLKEKGSAGVLADALYAHILPGFFAIYTFTIVADTELPISFAVLFILWSAAYGVRNIILHQLSDQENDQKTGTHTWISNRKSEAVHKALGSWYFALEVALFSLACCLSPWFSWPIHASYFGYLIMHVLLFPDIRSGSPQVKTKLIHDRLCNEWYERWFPLAVIFFAAWDSLAIAFGITLFHLLVFSFMFYEGGRWKIPFTGGRGMGHPHRN